MKNSDNKIRQTILFSISAIILLFTLFYLFLFTSPSAFPKNKIIKIQEGATIDEISKNLAEENIIRSSFIFKVINRLKGGNSDSGIISGTYYFNHRQNMFAIEGRLTRGEYGISPIKITIPEGLANYEIAEILSSKLPNFNKEKFLEKSEELEGYLFPDTYNFLPMTDEDEIISIMNNNFKDKIKKIKPAIDKSGRSLEEIIIMASILEKEARKNDDRKKIAGVLWKRYDAGMPLQVDATLTYIIGKDTYELTHKDLNFDSPYNTYKYKGLPKGPIANPGLDSIDAAVNYEENPYWYYLADRSGNTYFSKTFEEHVDKKNIYVY